MFNQNTQENLKLNKKINNSIELLSSRNVRDYTHEISLTWLPKSELNKDDINRHINL